MELTEYLDIVRKRLWIIVVVPVVAVILAAVVSFYILSPVYQANTTLYVGKNIDTGNAIAYNDIMVGNQLVKDYRELVKSRLIAGMVIKELGLTGMTSSSLSNMLSVNLKNDTRLIEVTAQAKTPEMAQKIADQVAVAFKEKAVELIDVQNVQVIDNAELPSAPVKPKKMLNVAIAAFVGLMAGFGITFLLEYLDSTIKTPNDVEKYIELPVIGAITEFNDNL